MTVSQRLLGDVVLTLDCLPACLVWPPASASQCQGVNWSHNHLMGTNLRLMWGRQWEPQRCFLLKLILISDLSSSMRTEEHVLTWTDTACSFLLLDLVSLLFSVSYILIDHKNTWKHDSYNVFIASSSRTRSHAPLQYPAHSSYCSLLLPPPPRRVTTSSQQPSGWPCWWQKCLGWCAAEAGTNERWFSVQRTSPRPQMRWRGWLKRWPSSARTDASELTCYR